MSEHYDFIVIGSGPAGKRAAVQSAKLGKRVLVVERGRKVGGVSVHSGTIPSKTMRETIMNLSGYRERSFYGRSYRAKDVIKADDLRERLRKTLSYEVDVLEHRLNDLIGVLLRRRAVKCVRQHVFTVLCAQAAT